MVFAWDHAGDGRCVQKWMIDVYPAGVKEASKRIVSTSVSPATTESGRCTCSAVLPVG